MGSSPKIVNGKVLAVCKMPKTKALVLIRKPEHFKACKYCVVYEDEDSFLFAQAVVLMARTGRVVRCPEDCYECSRQSSEWESEPAWSQLTIWTRIGMNDRHLRGLSPQRSNTTRPRGNYPLSMMDGSSRQRSWSRPKTRQWRGSRPRNFGKGPQGS